MCKNVIDGRYHTICQHFTPMSTRQQDCRNNACLFSSTHAPGCKHKGPCIRMMEPPQRNPIRISDTRCEGCVMRGPEGVLGRSP
ncbi:hypothetical protein QCA50_003140 [Cerrena zonata]|uniref:Uncharacterized protein n=1 Tax=Cerrena zonata TaxID=2478898 RepID=A0AAW0GVK3_9APHY